MAPTSDNGSRDAGETRTMQEGSMKFVVAAVGSDSEETAALLELLAGERLGFDRPQGEVDEDRPALLRHAPDSPRGYLYPSLSLFRNRASSSYVRSISS